MASRALLICGATGKQGGAVISTLLKEKAGFEILAVTRDANSASAQRLRSKAPDTIKLVQGDLADPAALFKTAKGVATNPIWGVFSVQAVFGGSELDQGTAMIDASLAADVNFFVYTSVDRHGAASLDSPTNIPHFIHKHKIEQHLISATKSKPSSSMEWTILRPVAFMENLTDNFFGRAFVSAWRIAVKDKPLQLIAVSDIGVFGAKAFMAPEHFKGKAVSLAGDEVTLEQAGRIFQARTGKKLVGTYGLLTRAILAMVKDMGLMFRWFYDVGYAADVKELKKTYPGLKDFGTWLETESDWATKK
ncbi:nucleoside-diphosphate-sugar epimerase family protein [Bombardia bombarda]|uniref:Nucleoside-diphosphate-sugar epimerase family protein n=1 Tax=Bombardia bombarda TaxID=252184 RepID=A0AA39W439_9PEZI|nr:nucleoside-diphosphate-sugar epimerase family protein [Bombardia bombarda]